jgi:hypothetical protein
MNTRTITLLGRARVARWILLFGLLGAGARADAVGTWTPIATPPPVIPSNVALLTDGSVLVGDGDHSTAWCKLTPDPSGSYANGSWSMLRSSQVARFAAPSTILRDGRYLIAGGEYVLSGTDKATVEIYDPATNTWSSAPDMPAPIGDTASSMLSDGRFFCSSLVNSNTYFFDPTANQWSFSGPIGTGDSGDEKGWVLLQDGSVLDAWNTGSRFYPAQNAWVATGPLPSSLVAGQEIGPMGLLYSGKVIQFGAAAPPAVGHTAIYDPSANSWTAGPDAPDGNHFADTGAAVMVNGNVLCETTNASSGQTFTGMWEYDPTANAFSSVPTPPGGTTTAAFLQLPNGQVMTFQGVSLSLYTPSGSPQSAWRPTISSVSPPNFGNFTVTGTQLNGLTTGAMFGDDHSMATNYPIAFLTDGANHVYYCRTHDFDQMAPQPALSSSFKMTVPDSVPDGSYLLHVSANGIEAANPTPISFAGNRVTSITAPVTVQNPQQNLTWTANISGPAPPGGELLVVQSSNTSVATVMSFLTVPAGATSVSFPVRARGFGSATIQAETGANGRTVASQVFGWTVTSLGGLPTAANGASATWSLALSNVAPSGGVVVNLQSSNTAVATVPATVIVPASATTATFDVSVGSNVGSGSATITASLIGSQQSAPFGYSIAGLAGPMVPPSGNTATWTVSLNGAAPTGGLVVGLTSSRTSVATVPASVTVPGGSSSATFPITMLSSGHTTTITASVAGTSMSEPFGGIAGL